MILLFCAVVPVAIAVAVAQTSNCICDVDGSLRAGYRASASAAEPPAREKHGTRPKFPNSFRALKYSLDISKQVIMLAGYVGGYNDLPRGTM